MALQVKPDKKAAWGWENTREAYTDWVADWGARSGLKEAFRWRGFSLWWCCNLVNKDAEVDKAWCERLHHRLCGEAEPVGRVLWEGGSIGTLLSLFLVDVLKWMVVKALFCRQRTPRGRIWFHSLSSNLRWEEGVVCDRHFSVAHLRDQEHCQTSAYAVKLILGAKDLARPFLWKRRMEHLLLGIQRDVVILNRFLTLFDVLDIHWNVARNWIRFRRMARGGEFRRGFTISGVPCDDILVEEFERSFFGAIQNSLLYGALFQRWLEDCKETQTIVTYGELLSQIRPVYHAAKAVNPENKFIAVQHSINSRNKLGFYHRAKEFSGDDDWDGIRHSPRPDYYFVQGAQYSRILEEFFPADRIRIIGCLKYDKYREVIARRHHYEDECRKVVGGNLERILVIAPSVNDVGDILELFRGAVMPAGWRVIVSPHPAVPMERINGLILRMGISVPMESFAGLATYQLLTIADVVVCGYSAVALEAAIFGVPSVRVRNQSTFPLFEDEPGIPSFQSGQAFRDWLVERFTAPGKEDEADETRKLLGDYFYRIDGQSADRLWSGVLDVAGGAEHCPITR